jgi:hypothetical protein
LSQELRAICPSCSSVTLKGRVDPKFYYNPDKEVGYCHHCGFKGRFNEEIVDNLNVVSITDRIPFDETVFDSLEPLPPEALRYLSKRFPDIRQDQLDVFKLRYSKQHHAIAIPTLQNEKVTGIKYRFIAPSGNDRYTSATASQFGGYWIGGRTDKLLIVEGEFDAMTAKLLGFEGSILALQTNKLSQESVNRVRQFRYVFLSLDDDKAGEEGAQTIRQILGFNQPVQVKLPGKDLNEVIQKEGKDESYRLLKEATRTEIEKATVSLRDSISELVEFLSDTQNTRGTTTGYQSIDKLLGGGLRTAEMTVVNAFAKTGKTSFINNIVHNLACIGKKVAIASFEMDPARTLYPSLLSIAGQTNLRKLNDKDLLTESVNLIQRECEYLHNIITFRRFGYTPWNEVEEWATLMKERMNIEYLVLDHAGFMVEKMTDAEENQILAKNIKKLTNTLGVHILVVVQAPKTKDGLSIQTSYGGLGWGMNSDNFIILERTKENDAQLNVRLEASRYPGANPSYEPARLFYDRETCTLTD